MLVAFAVSMTEPPPTATMASHAAARYRRATSATTPVDPRVAAKMIPWLTEKLGINWVALQLPIGIEDQLKGVVDGLTLKLRTPLLSFAAHYAYLKISEGCNNSCRGCFNTSAQCHGFGTGGNVSVSVLSNVSGNNI